MQTADTKPGLYYVTVKKDGGNDFRYLLGPYKNDHQAALNAVTAATKMANDLDPKAAWYFFGTARVDLPEPGQPVELGILNKYFDEALQVPFTPAKAAAARFKEAYKAAIATARVAFPSQYRWPADKLDELVDKMIAGLADKTAAWDGPSVKKACAAVGIKQQQGAIAKFLQAAA